MSNYYFESKLRFDIFLLYFVKLSVDKLRFEFYNLINGNLLHNSTILEGCITKPSYHYIHTLEFFDILWDKNVGKGGFDMLVEEINRLRELLNEQVINCSMEYDEILSLSQDLDKLIVEYYKNELLVRNTCSSAL